jgi:dextranase
MRNKAKKLTKPLQLWAIIAALLLSCRSLSPTPSPLWLNSHLELSKTRYSPEETIPITLSLENIGSEPQEIILQRQITHLGRVIDERSQGPLLLVPETPLAIQEDWVAPPEDYRGYRLDYFFLDTEGQQLASIALGIDVSSNWERYPRYGYLSEFPKSLYIDEEDLVHQMAQFQISGIQYYDWHHRHESPYSPEATWEDLARRTISRETINNFITAAQSHGMKSMAYNLIHGAFTPEAEDVGLTREMGLFIREGGRVTQDFHPLPSAWMTDKLYLTNPADPAWQELIARENRRIFTAPDLDFDGWHMDTLGNRAWGDRETLTADGTPIELKATYAPFISRMKAQAFSQGGKDRIVFNTVSAYGFEELADHPDLDFLYAELWDGPGEGSYTDLFRLFQKKESLTDKALVIAGYVNEKLGDNYSEKAPGTFHEPSLFLAEAAIMALGGQHIALGDGTHYLLSPYFPNKKLLLSGAQKIRLRDYYQALTAYQEILRGDSKFLDLPISSPRVPTSSDGRADTLWAFARGNGGTALCRSSTY